MCLRSCRNLSPSLAPRRHQSWLVYSPRLGKHRRRQTSWIPDGTRTRPSFLTASGRLTVLLGGSSQPLPRFRVWPRIEQALLQSPCFFSFFSWPLTLLPGLDFPDPSPGRYSACDVLFIWNSILGAECCTKCKTTPGLARDRRVWPRIELFGFWQQERSMQDIEPGSSHTSTLLRGLLGEIETRRFRRQEDIKEHPHPQLKRFTQQELTDETCPTYKNLLVGRSLRVPSRETILHIAQYLERTAQERNDLLLAARYLP